MSYDTAGLLKRIKLKAYTSASSSLSDSDILDLANDSLRDYLVPITKTLREEYWVCPDDIVIQTDSNGGFQVPDTVSSTIRTIAWDNAGILTPLTRIEPELSFQYLPLNGALPMGFELRGYRIQILPRVPNVSIHITAMIRPPEMVQTQDAAQVVSAAGAVLTLKAPVPLEWQSSTPASVDLVSSVSPFSTIATYDVSSLSGTTLTLTEAPPSVSGTWVSNVGTSPFPNIPIELHALLQQDVIVQLFGTGIGDKRFAGAQKRKDELEDLARRTMSPRTQGNTRAIVNYAAPGMRNWFGGFVRGR